MKTIVVNLRYHRYDVYIGRGSKWGNPYHIGIDGDREEVIDKYKDYLKTKPNLLSSINELQGKILGCFCKPEKCHGDILAKLADKSTRA